MPSKCGLIVRTIKLDRILPDAVCHGDALVFAAVPIRVRAVHVQGAAHVAYILVVAGGKMGPVVTPKTFRLDAFKEFDEIQSMVEIGRPFG